MEKGLVQDTAGQNFRGVFTFSTLKGTDHSRVKKYSPQEWAEIENRVHRMKHNDIVDFWREFGAREDDRIESRNRLVDQGLGLITLGLSTGTTTVATKIQLGRGSTGAWSRSLGGVRTAIADGFGLDEAAATITDEVSGDAGSENDILRAAKTFTSTSATAYNDPGEGADEAAIRTTTGPKCICYTYFTERLLGNGDQLVVTYNLKFVP